MEIKIKATTAVTEDKKVRYAVLIEEDDVFTASSISKDRDILFEQNNDVSELINTIACLRYAIWYLNKEHYNEPLTLLTEQKQIVEYLNKSEYAVTDIDVLNKKIYGLKKMLEENRNVSVAYFNPEEDESYQQFLEENFPTRIVESKVDDEQFEKIAETISEEIDCNEFFESIESRSMS